MKRNLRVQSTNTLANEIRTQFSLHNVLYINLSRVCVFGSVSNYANMEIFGKNKADVLKEKDGPMLIGDPLIKLDEVKDTFDLIIGDLPLGMQSEEWIDETKNLKLKANRNWLILLKSLFLLKKNGYGLYLVEPAFGSLKWGMFSEELNKQGFFINAIFNPPEKILFPETGLRPNLVLVSRKKADKLFIAELDETDTNGICPLINNLSNAHNTDRLEEGIFIEETDFKDFFNFKISNQIEKLKTAYKEYASYRLTDISVEINLGKPNKEFEDIKNSIYVPSVGNSPVVSDIKFTKLKRQNYIQVVLNDSIVNNQFLELFFSSDLGDLVRKSLQSGSVIPHVNKRDLTNILVPVPPLEEQNEIVTTYNNLDKLTITIEKFTKELSLNPKSATSINSKVIDLLEGINKLSDADRVRSVIRKGESKTCEFKQTLSLDIRKDSKEKYIEKAVLKTVVAFLNTEGGNLLVGVSDDGRIHGLQEEIKRFHKNNDKFLLHFRNLIRDQIGEQFYPYINYSLVEIDANNILFVECSPSETACFLNGKEFFVRTNPATDLLEGIKLLEYVNKRFAVDA